MYFNEDTEAFKKYMEDKDMNISFSGTQTNDGLKVGDYIRAYSGTKGKYSVTNHEAQYPFKVISISSPFNIVIEVNPLDSALTKGYISSKVFEVESKYFYKVNEIPMTVNTNEEKKSMLKELGQDVKGFIKDNRQVIFTIALVAVVDHFMFNGALRKRIQDVLEKLLNKVESSVEPKQ